MGVRIDAARHHEGAAGIDDSGACRGLEVGPDGHDQAAFAQHVRPDAGFGIDDGAAADEDAHGVLLVMEITKPSRRADETRSLESRVGLRATRGNIQATAIVAGLAPTTGNSFALASIACSSTLPPASIHSGLASSISLWLMPPMQGTKTIAVGVTFDM